MSEPVPVYFYTTDTPFEWSSGASMRTHDIERGWAPIESLERAKEIAESEAGWRTRGNGRIFYSTSYGVSYKIETEPYPR